MGKGEQYGRREGIDRGVIALRDAPSGTLLARGASRIAYLDGLRGLAVMLVVGWHYLGPTYAARLPYGSALSWVPPFAFGWVGVEIFFLISGYVIFMTLERCQTFGDFMLRRWLRLWPSLQVAAVLTLIASWMVGAHMPGGRHGLIDLLPSLSMVAPAFWHALLHRPITSIDGVFWTLYDEVAFYVIFGLLFFALGWRRALAGLIALWAAALLAGIVVGPHGRGLTRIVEPLEWAGLPLFGWFASGALFMKAEQLSSRRLFWIALVCGLVSASTYRSTVPLDAVTRAMLFVCAILFASSRQSAPLQAVLRTKPMLFLGRISYSLYLIHSEIGVAALSLIGERRSGQWARAALPVLITLLMIQLAWWFTRYIEEPSMRILKASLPLTRKAPSPRSEGDKPSIKAAEATGPIGSAAG